MNGLCENNTCQCSDNSRIGGRFCEQVQLGEPCALMYAHTCRHARKAPPPNQTDITATWPTQFDKCPILSTCVDYYDTPVNVSATLSGESNRDVLLTWEEPPGYESIIGLWYRVRLYSYSYSYRFSYRFSYSYVTTMNTAFLWEDLAPSTYYCASVRVDSVHSWYTYYSNDVCFYTGGSQGECTVGYSSLSTAG